MNKEKIREQVSATCDNFVAGRTMALTFKPLTIEDIREAYMCGVEDTLQFIDDQL